MAEGSSWMARNRTRSYEVREETFDQHRYSRMGEGKEEGITYAEEENAAVFVYAKCLSLLVFRVRMYQRFKPIS